MIETIPAGDRKTWLSLRARDVTASAAAALVGAHPFITPWQLHALKTGRITEDPEESPPMMRGRLLEPVAVQMLREKRPDWRIVHNTGVEQVYLRDPSIRLGATPDVLVHCTERGKGIVQLKSVEASVFRSKWQDDEGETAAPLWIDVQAIIEAHMTGADFAMVGALVVSHGIDLHLVEVPLHEGVLARIKDETVEFWRRIEAGEDIAPDYGHDGELIAGLYDGADNGREIDLTADNRIRGLLEERREAKAAIQAQAAILAAIDAEIIHKIGDHERAHVPGWRISRPVTHRRPFWVEAASFRKLNIREVR